MGGHPAAVGTGDGQHVGEVHLTLGVARGHLRQSPDDHPTVRCADHPAVPGGVGDLRGEHRDGVPGTLVLVDQLAQGVGPQQRDVAVGHHDGAAQVVQHGKTALNRTAGALDVVLVGDDSVRRHLLDVRVNLVALVPYDHHEVGGVEAVGSRQCVPEQAASADLVQDLRDGGLHPRALARGEDDDCGRTGRGHAVRS